MLDWSPEQLAIRDAVRRFVDEEVRPRLDDLEHGDTPPYDVMRRLYRTFGLDDMARERVARVLRTKRATESASPADPGALATGDAPDGAGGDGAGGDGAADGGMTAALTLIPTIELSRCCPGIVTAMGVSVGLAGGTILREGTAAQIERWAADLLTLERIGAWAITEPGSGSDALGGMRTTARPDGDELVINGSKTFITNGPHADTVVLYAKLDDGSDASWRDRPVVTVILDRGMPGLEQSRPLRKMGLHSSPTGELFLTDVRVGPDRILGSGASSSGSPGRGRASARRTFVAERASLAAMALGVIEECLALSVDYARTRTLWDRPIGEFQLVQLKLATMEVARRNVENLVFRYIELQAAGKTPSLAEASAMKLYAAQAASQVAMEAVQLFGGNGYMAEYRVEQLARDAKVFQIYAGTDEIQVTHIARDLLGR